jgi:hypothetical protein
MPVVTWDSVNKGSGVTLSNGNLTATISNYYSTVRATISRNSGKWYWEIRCDSLSNAEIGIVNSTAGVGKTYDNINAMYYYSYNGSKWNGTSSPYGTTYTTGNVISVLLDLDNGTIEFWKNGVSQGVAFTNVKSLGEVYPAVTSASGAVGGTFTANFGASPFVYEIPYGYYSYDGNQAGFINRFLVLSSDGEIKTISNNIYDNATDIVPIMTNYTNGAIQISASSEYSSSYLAWQAFNDTTSTATDAWLTASGKTVDEWIKIDFGEKVIVTSYSITSRNNATTNTPYGWKLQGSNDNITWDDLDVVTGETSWSALQKRTYQNKIKIDMYRYYRFLITDAGGMSYCGFGEIEMFGGDVYVKSISSQTEQDFINYGMNSLSLINPRVEIQKKIYIQNSNSPLGSGKTFTQQIDLTRYKINKISFE